ncbi:DUF6668 family protein [Streptomyces sp. NPDC049099]|uniref:DUF6668 family protein n=1 Tax=Streptomyces sp. NPDC049099 TaxID=3155768 RepID=UPI00341E2D4A
MQETNPWVSKPVQTDSVGHQGAKAPDVAPTRLTGPHRPQPRTVQQPVGGLPVFAIQPGVEPAFWWVSCHGGAGSSTLATAIGLSGAEAGGYWPAPPRPALARVVLVARTHHYGLTRAQLAGRQWASAQVPEGVEVLGLVQVADAPGKLPRELRELAHLVGGGFPRLWRIPWIEDLRRGATLPPDHPALRQLGLDLYHITSGGTRHA